MRGIFGKLWGRRRVGVPRTVLGRLARDTRGNTLAIMAAALVPFCGMVGGGIDLSRMYITKTRLQHACDAGALAGRKTMGAGVWTSNNNAANAAAQQFFDANFSAGSYGSYALTKSFSENAGKVTGSASASLPMTLMQVLGKGDETLTVTCDAEMRLPNTDVMFVLDTTGSMNCAADNASCTNNGGVPAANSKIAGLKVAVKCFYEIVARLDTDATCTTGTPSGGTGNQVQIRFGFMPYATNVNVGRLLPTSYLADKWTYQSRKANTTTTSVETWPQTSQTTSSRASSQPSAAADCTQANADAIYKRSSTTTTGNTRVTTDVTVQNLAWSNYVCSGNLVTVTTTYTRTTTVNVAFRDWHYGPVEQVVSGLKNGTNWNGTVDLPIGPNGAARTVTWDGCIEERRTVKANSYSPIPSDAKDLDIDLVPSQSDATTLWGPALNGALFTRNSLLPAITLQNIALWTRTESDSVLDYSNTASYYCPTQATKLKVWPDATTFDAYVDGLSASGNTYHDIGLLWGARFMSPTGIFGSENALTSQGGEIDRNLIFMTDGDTAAQNYDYNAYGVPFFDRRQTDDGTVPTSAMLEDQVNKRFLALCDAVKNKNITLWVISFGNGSNAATESRLSQCATSGRYFAARDSATLQSTFAAIANQISSLRLTR